MFGGDGGRGKPDPHGIPFLTEVGGSHIAEKLIKADKVEEFEALTAILDENEARDFAATLAKARKYKLTFMEDILFSLLRLKTSIGGRRAIQFQQAISYLAESVRAYQQDGKSGEKSETNQQSRL